MSIAIVETFAVYRVLEGGKLRYLSHSVTTSQKLAEGVARDLTEGRVIMPDGSEHRIPAAPHVARRVGEVSS